MGVGKDIGSSECIGIIRHDYIRQKLAVHISVYRCDYGLGLIGLV